MRRGVRGLVSEGGESSVGVAKMRVEGATGGTLLGTMLIVRREWNEDREEEERVEKKDEGREGRENALLLVAMKATMMVTTRWHIASRMDA